MLLTRRIGVKVPQVTIGFWVVKILTTAMGEATSDYSVHQIDPVIAVTFGFLGFVIALALQLRLREYVVWIYWLAVVMVAVFGTMAADVLHVRFGVPYVVSTIGFAIVLAAVFITWYRVEGTLSIHSINTTRRELFYWATVLATFALGTAAGDMTAYTLHLGFFSSALLFAAAISVPALAYRFTGVNAIAAFWCAYVLTRPLGASFADWMGTPHNLGGLNWGRGNVSIGLTLLIVVGVALLARTRRVPVSAEAGA
ncbi:MAG TPA: hypothetical protein VIJ96_18535 [Acidothermaceae bacterium]